MIKKHFLYSFITFILICFALLSVPAWAQPVSILGNVEADSFDTALTVQVRDQQVSAEDFSDMLRPGGGHVFRVTSINGFLLNGPVPPSNDDYAVVFLGALGLRNSIRGFGAGTIALDGRGSNQVNFRPGLFVNLLANESLVLRSMVQSNQQARIEVHGFLRPAN